jgi:hypothetical protein
MDVRWAPGECTVSWGEVVKNYEKPPRSVVAVADPPGVLVVEALAGAGSNPDNAVFFNEDGTERVRLKPLDFAEKHWRIGYDQAFMSNDRLVVVYLGVTADRWGTPDFDTGELRDVHEWR